MEEREWMNREGKRIEKKERGIERIKRKRLIEEIREWGNEWREESVKKREKKGKKRGIKWEQEEEGTDERQGA